MSKNTKSKDNGIRKYNAKTEVKLVYFKRGKSLGEETRRWKCDGYQVNNREEISNTVTQTNRLIPLPGG